MKNLKSPKEFKKLNESEVEEPTATTETKEESHTITISGSKEGIDALAELIEYIKATGNTGHSFTIKVDPDDAEHAKDFGWDGDGNCRIEDINVQHVEAEEKDDPDTTSTESSIAGTATEDDSDPVFDTLNAFSDESVNESHNNLVYGEGQGSLLAWHLDSKEFSIEASDIDWDGQPVTIKNPKTGKSMTFKNPKVKKDAEGEIQYWTLVGTDGVGLIIWND
jgi:hypothetical protein